MTLRISAALFLAFMGSTSFARAESLDSIISDHVEQLREAGNEIAAFRLLDRLVTNPACDSDELKRLRLELASQLIYVDGQTDSKIDLSMDLNEEFSATHPIFPSKGQDIKLVSQKLANAELLFRDVLRDDDGISIKIKKYPANHSLNVTTTLRNHLKLISIARNPSLNK